MPVRVPRLLVLLPLVALLSGCSTVLMSPSGDVAVQQRNLIIASTGLMLLIILPVMVATAVFAWRYRAANTKAAYDPEWHHSTQLEVLIWTAPLLIVVALGAMSWIGTHTLDPFRSVARIDPTRPVAAGTRPLTVEVVALDWKWLFFYPDYGIAVVNDLAAPVDRPIAFKLTSGTVMNTFFVPALAGQIYAMAGMETKLGAVINKVGDYEGFSGMYSGAGFSHMRFTFHGRDDAGFEAWIAKVKAQGTALDLNRFRFLEQPTEDVKPQYYSSVEPGLYDRILNMCTEPGKMCMDRMMAIDAAGGGGKDSGENRDRLTYDGARLKEGNEAPGATFPASGRPPNTNVQPQGMNPRPLSPDVNQKRDAPDDSQGSEMPGMGSMPGMKTSPGMKPQNPAPAQLNPH